MRTGRAKNRAELQRLTEQRLLDAEALFASGRREFAYYAVECALKSCVRSRMPLTGWVFQEKKADQCLTHD